MIRLHLGLGAGEIFMGEVTGEVSVLLFGEMDILVLEPVLEGSKQHVKSKILFCPLKDLVVSTEVLAVLVAVWFVADVILLVDTSSRL